MQKRTIVGVVVAVCVLLVLVVALWPASPLPVVEDSQPSLPDAGQTAPSSGALSRLRHSALPDGGFANAAAPARPDVIATFTWGGGEGQLGRNRPEEANPEGPMSLTIDAQGNTWVLDQVNNRLVKLDKNGKPSGSMPLSVQGAQDVAVAKDGTVMVLDRLLDKTVSLNGPDGKPIGELPIEGKAIEEGGAVTGLFNDGDDVYVEREHGDLVKVGTTKGVANPNQEEVPGRLSRDGKVYLNAGLVDPGSDRVYVNVIDRASMQHRYTREYRTGSEVMAITLLDSDGSGVVYLGMLLDKSPPLPPGADPEAPPTNVVTSLLLYCLDPLDGRPIGRAELPPNMDADETFREMTVRDEGGVLYLYRTEAGAELRRIDCQ